MKKLFSVLTGIMLVGSQAYAHHVEQSFDLGAMAKEASMVFKGTVVSIDYRGAKQANGKAPLPHTFVTYAIDEVYHGNPGATHRKEFTLRFIGGRGENNQDLIVDVLPKFDIGDQDILFVKGNGVSECPLVNCANGRLRVVNDMVYNEYGQQVILNEKGKILLGDMVDDKAFTEYKIGDDTIGVQRHSSEPLDDSGHVIEPEKSKSHGIQLTSSDLDSQLEQALIQAMPNDPRGKSKTASNADKNKPFNAADAKPSRPANLVKGPKNAGPKTDEEDAAQR